MSESFYVIDIDTAKNILDKSYSSRGWANRASEKAKIQYPTRNLQAMSGIEWMKIDEEVEIGVLMNPEKKVKIRKSEVGTCCDPSTERYWTM